MAMLQHSLCLREYYFMPSYFAYSLVKILDVEHGLDFSSFLICSCVFNRKVVVNVSTAFSVSILKINHKRGYALERLPLHCVMQYCVYADHRHLFNT